MKVTTITKNKLEQLHPLKLGKEICNSECVIYDFYHQKEHKVLKYLKELEGEYLATKLYTVAMLDYYSKYFPQHFYIPDSLVALDNDLVGFTVPFAEGINLATILKSNQVSFKLKIYYLKKLGQLLEEVKTIRKNTPLKDFYFNDIHESNFIVNFVRDELGAIDLDSSKIGNNGVFPSRYASPYSLAQCNNEKYKVNESGFGGGYLVPNENSEIYCYVMTILNFIFGDNFFRIRLHNFNDYLNKLEQFGFDKELISIFERIVLSKDNINPSPYLESLTETQINKVRSLFH